MTSIKNRLLYRLSELVRNEKGQTVSLFPKRFVLYLSLLSIAFLAPATAAAQSAKAVAVQSVPAQAAIQSEAIWTLAKQARSQPGVSQSATAESAVVQEIAQASATQSAVPGAAFLRSLAVPGWGHYYADRQNWNRGKLHLAADILLIAGLTGSVIQERNLHTTYHTHASLKAGVDIKNRGRSFQLAVGGYENLGEYNDYQLRSRNWSRIFPDDRENRWEWRSEEDRRHYNELRNRRENVKNRVPMIAGAMVVNRVLSAIGAYNRARNRTVVPELSVSPVYDDHFDIGGYMGTLRFTY